VDTRKLDCKIEMDTNTCHLRNGILLYGLYSRGHYEKLKLSAVQYTNAFSPQLLIQRQLRKSNQRQCVQYQMYTACLSSSTRNKVHHNFIFIVLFPRISNLDCLLLVGHLIGIRLREWRYSFSTPRVIPIKSVTFSRFPIPMW